MQINQSPLDQLPSPLEIHAHMGRLYRELSLLRRLLRLSQTAQDQQLSGAPGASGQGVGRAS
jgi:hypothetical protein